MPCVRIIHLVRWRRRGAPQPLPLHLLLRPRRRLPRLGVGIRVRQPRDTGRAGSQLVAGQLHGACEGSSWPRAMLCYM